MLVDEIFKRCISSLSPLYDTDEATRITEWVFEDILNIHFSEVKNHLNDDLTDRQQKKLTDRLVRLMQSEPVQYVLGYSYFMDLKLNVNKNVLIPRPETEELVDLVIKQNPSFKGTVVDIGTGSGCIALSLSKKLKGATVYASDVSEDAICIASKSSAENQLSCQFIHDSILNPDLDKYPNVDLIVSNPPYIEKKESVEMHDNVLKHEPHLALFANEHPLEFYTAILKFAQHKLTKQGSVYLELNPVYANDVAALFSNAGFALVQIHDDLSGKKRFLSCVN